MAKGDSIKELTKTSKKLRPSQSQTAGEGATPPAPEEWGDQPSDTADRYPWKKDHRDHNFLGRRKADAE